MLKYTEGENIVSTEIIIFIENMMEWGALNC